VPSELCFPVAALHLVGIQRWTLRTWLSKRRLNSVWRFALLLSLHHVDRVMWITWPHSVTCHPRVW
jgi:hypothetical protein